MKLICHIGTPKTASTFLQDSCEANWQWLADRGVLYPNTLSPDANHITLSFVADDKVNDFMRHYGLQTQDDVSQLRSKLSKTLADQLSPDYHTVIMSSENLTGSMRPTGIANLRRFLAPLFEEIEIVVYIRRQDEGFLSMYSEYMRRGFATAEFEAWTDRHLGPTTLLPYLDYQTMLQPWIDAFGAKSVTVRRFGKAQASEQGILGDFMGLALGDDADLTGLVSSSSTNARLSAPALEYLRHLTREFPFMKDGAPNMERVQLDDAIDMLPGQPRPTLSKAQSARIMERFKAGNDWLRDTFFPEVNGPLFPPRQDMPEKSNIGALTHSQSVAFSAMLLRQLMKQNSQ